jgi:hypothetical protein
VKGKKQRYFVIGTLGYAGEKRKIPRQSFAIQLCRNIINIDK